MNAGYLIYQAERTPSAAEQREIDRSNAQLVAAVARLWRTLAAPARWRRSRRSGLARLAEGGASPAAGRVAALPGPERCGTCA